jgi:hypothetical protein
MALDLSGCRAKINRAYEHRYSLQAIIDTADYGEPNQIQLRADLDPKTSDTSLASQQSQRTGVSR